MKKLLMLIIIVASKLTAFSQIDTTYTNIKCFPIPVVKMIIKDLLSGDSAKSLLVLTEKQLSETENKVSLKDSIISSMKVKEINYNTVINSEKEKYFTLSTYTKTIEVKLKIANVKNKFKSIVSVVIIGALGFFLITK